MKKLLLFILVISISTTVFADPGDILDTFTLSGQHAYGVRGLAWIGGDDDADDPNFWAADIQYSDDCYFGEFDGTTHATVQDWQTLENMYWIMDIAYDGTYLYGADYNSNTIDVFDPSDGSLVDEYAGPGSLGDYLEGLAYCESTGYLYCTYFYTNTMYVVDPSDGSLIDTWSGILPYTQGNNGVASYGDYIFVNNNNYFEIYVIDVNTGTIEDTIGFNIGGNYNLGLCWAPNGDPPSLYTTTFTNYTCYEIEVAFPDTNITSTSLGNIKNLFAE